MRPHASTHPCKYRDVFRSFSCVLIVLHPSFASRSVGCCINHFHAFPGKQGKATQEIFSPEARLSSGSGVAKILIILSKLSGKALLEFTYRPVVGLVGLCNRILHTTVYRLLWFCIGNAMCIFNCPEGSGIPRYITAACVSESSYDRSLSMQSGSPSTCFAKHFPGVQTVVRTVYNV